MSAWELLTNKQSNGEDSDGISTRDDLAGVTVCHQHEVLPIWHRRATAPDHGVMERVCKECVNCENRRTEKRYEVGLAH